MALTIQELANDPLILEVSKIDDALFPLLSKLERAVILASREVMAEYGTSPGSH